MPVCNCRPVINDVFKTLGCRRGLALGMESGVISDGQISASSLHTRGYAAKWARLHIRAGGGSQGCWIPSNGDTAPWLQIDLGSTLMILAAATQGNHEQDQWVTSYSLQYREDIAAILKDYIEPGQTTPKVTKILKKKQPNFVS